MEAVTVHEKQELRTLVKRGLRWRVPAWIASVVLAAVMEALLPSTELLLTFTVLYIATSASILFYYVACTAAVGVPWSWKDDVITFLVLFIGPVISKTALLVSLCRVVIGVFPCRTDIWNFTLADFLLACCLYAVAVWPGLRRYWREKRAEFSDRAGHGRVHSK